MMKTWIKLLLFIVYSIIVIYVFHFAKIGNDDVGFLDLLYLDIFIIALGSFIVAPLLSRQIKIFWYRLLFFLIATAIILPIVLLYNENKSDKPYIFNVRIVD